MEDRNTMMECIIYKWLEAQGIPLWVYPVTVIAAGIVGGVIKCIIHIRKEK